MKKIFKKSITTLVIGVVALSSTSTIYAKEVNVNRIAGSNRVNTAIEISKELGVNRSTAIISSTEGNVDALTSTLLASELGAVQLLSGPNSLTKNVKNQLKELKVREVYLIGGESVLSKSIEDELNKSYKVKRIAGRNRVDTSSKVIDELSKVSDNFFLVNGYDGLADALSIGPVAGRDTSPILLTQKDSIPKETMDKIRKKSPEKITIVGGTSVISKKVEDELKKYTKVDRISGNNRGSTSVEIAKEYYDNPKGTIFANGYTFADALSGGYYAVEKDEPIVLLTNNGKNKEANDYVRENGTDLTFLGGNKAISQSTERQIVSSSNEFVDGTDEPVDEPEDDSTDKPDDNINEGVDEPDEPSKDKIKTKDDLMVEIEKQLMNRSQKFTIDYYGNDFDKDKTISETINKLRKSGSYTTGSVSNWSMTTRDNGDHYSIDLRPGYRTTDAQEQFINDEVKRISDKVIKGNMSEFEKVRALHDYIVDNTTYSSDTKTSRHSAYTLLKEGKGVCNAYGLAMSKLYDHNGIDNRFVVGDGKSKKKGTWGLHAWNKVKVDGKWYNVDTTWSFPKAEHGLHNAYYYFLVSDKRFNTNHRAHEEDMLPKATDSQYDGQFDGIW